MSSAEVVEATLSAWNKGFDAGKELAGKWHVDAMGRVRKMLADELRYYHEHGETYHSRGYSEALVNALDEMDAFRSRDQWKTVHDLFCR